MEIECMLLKNEIRFLFTKRYFMILILGIVGIISVFFFKYNLDFMHYGQNQIEYYSEVIQTETQRMSILPDEEMNSFFQEDSISCQKLLSDWKNGADDKTIAFDLYKRDLVMLDYIKSGMDLEKFPTILQNSKADLLLRIKMEKICLDKETYDFVYPNKPTGYYLLIQIMGGNNLFFYLLLIVVLSINIDIWSKDLENGMIQSLFTIGKIRRSIYITRTTIRILWSIAVSLLFLVVLFSIGLFTYGNGTGLYVGTISANQYFFNHCLSLITLIIFSVSFCQSLSFFVKNTGICLLLTGLILLFMYTYIDISILLNSTFVFVIGSVFFHLATLISLERADLG